MALPADANGPDGHQPQGLVTDRYFTQADATLVFPQHPDAKFRGALDCAHFALTHGRSPIHVWNYAHRPGPDGQGGTPFDDTALGHEMCQLQVVFNAARWREAKAWAAATRVGDAVIRYERTDGWDAHVYRSSMHLEQGTIAQVGLQLEGQAGVHPAVVILFERVRGEAPATDQVIVPREERVRLELYQLDTATHRWERERPAVITGAYARHGIRDLAQGAIEGAVWLGAPLVMGDDAMWVYSPVKNGYHRAGPQLDLGKNGELVGPPLEAIEQALATGEDAP